MSGITRIHIEDEIGNYSLSFQKRTQISRNSINLFNNIYRQLLPLEDGEDVQYVRKDELMGRYDSMEGIDVILNLKNNVRLTLQEKCLTTRFNTVTFETQKNSETLGSYYTCTAQLYFVGYVNEDFTQCLRYCLLDFARFKIMYAQGNILCHHNQNNRDGNRQKFMYCDISCLPSECVIART